MQTYTFRLLRYVPDTVKHEFVNIGVVLLDADGRALGSRMAGEDDLRRVRCLHPAADLELLRSWQAQVESRLAGEAGSAAVWLAELDESASHTLEWTPAKGCESADAGSALQDLYDALVASPPRPAAGARAGTGAWVKREADAVFRAEKLLEKFEAGIWAHEFTGPGDPFRIHYRYRNGAAHYVHMLSLQHSVQQSKVLAFTFERIRRVESGTAMTAVVEPEPWRLPTAAFTRQTLADSGIEVLPLDRIQGFVRRVKERLNHGVT